MVEIDVKWYSNPIQSEIEIFEADLSDMDNHIHRHINL